MLATVELSPAMIVVLVGPTFAGRVPFEPPPELLEHPARPAMAAAAIAPAAYRKHDFVT
ncbi:MAG TPA: hypothetical protein VGI86_06155 [Acidimicrobiia bacterium]